jgi:pSer/pThr/pTyr-binding forkhead associated (FHA) protein
MILGNSLVTLGTSEKASLIFIAFGAKGVEPIHLKITRQSDGRYLLEDNQSRGGTLLNGHPVSGPTALKDGDAIQFGVNVVRFNERAKRSAATVALSVAASVPKAAIATTAITSKPPIGLPANPAPSAAIQTAPAPIAAPAAPAPKPEKARCPICDKEIEGIPGKRRCGKCFTTF